MGLLVLGCMPEYVGGLTMSNSFAFFFFFCFFFFFSVTLVLTSWFIRIGRRIASRESPLETTGSIHCEAWWSQVAQEHNISCCAFTTT